ncbi:MAG: hypothetical protein EHM93_13685 [Bacteroidales bacterium]|nr:MAG: hypothetical protein EHM93_13685 [Bacteroidales bacterium]
MNFYKVLSLLLFFSYNICFSQVEIQWEKKIGKKDFFYSANSIIQTYDSCFVITGCKEKAIFDSELLVIKLDNKGNVIWESEFKNQNYDKGCNSGESIVQMADSSFVISGYTGKFGIKKIWVLRIDRNGKMIWEWTYGDYGLNDGNVLKTTLSNELVLAGRCSAGETNLLLAKFDITGKIIWGNYYKKDTTEWVGDIITTEHGNIYAIGNYSVKNTNKVFMKEFRSDGKAVNEFFFNSCKFNLWIKSLLLSDNNLLILGSEKNQKDDLKLLKVDLSGNLIWEKTIGTKQNDYPSGIIEITKNKYILTGWTGNKGKGGFDGWLVGIDYSGNKEWDMNLGGKKNDVILSLTRTLDNGFVIAGFTKSESAGNGDAWIVKIK